MNGTVLGFPSEHFQMGGTCCSTKPPDPTPDTSPTSQVGHHHSVLVTPTKTLGTSTTYNIVYRPPHMNQRLAPGEARPKFWLSPTLNTLTSTPIVSVAWTQPQPNVLELSEAQNQTLQQNDQPEETHSPGDFKPQQNTKKISFKLKSSTVAKKWRPRLRKPTCNSNSHIGDTKSNIASLPLDDCLSIRPYPPFLVPHIDKVIRLRLVFVDPYVEQLVGEHGHLRYGHLMDPMSETAHLVRCMHSLRVNFTHSSNLRGLPDVTVMESHGGVKRLRRVRYRSMFVTWIDLDHRKPGVKVVGEQFQLTLSPPCMTLTPEDFHDSNGETPCLLGTYERALDTCPERRLVFSARLYNWFNQSGTVPPGPCYSDFSDVCEQSTVSPPYLAHLS